MREWRQSNPMRKTLRKYLPTPESLLERKGLRWLAPALSHPRLWHLHRRSVALGIAIGLVTGLIPGPVQMLLGALIAIPLRANIPATVFATLYTNPLTFVPLYLLAYNIGSLVTGESAPLMFPPDTDWSWVAVWNFFPELLKWMVAVGDTLLIGLAIQCTIFAITGYFATLIIWRVVVTLAWRRRSRLRRLHQSPASGTPS
jgi:uncharacterized protein (DUF2062 family)